MKSGVPRLLNTRAVGIRGAVTGRNEKEREQLVLQEGCEALEMQAKEQETRDRFNTTTNKILKHPAAKNSTKQQQNQEHRAQDNST